MKLLIQERYRGDIHYVWCSEQPDSGAVSPLRFASLTAPTSNPRDIYKDLREACNRTDKHNAKIVSTRANYVALAEQWFTANEITSEDREEILHLVGTADFSLWRPMLYVIPRASIDPARLSLVPMARRASPGPEWIIADLHRSEFDVVEL
jgi:hypothetical protein